MLKSPRRLTPRLHLPLRRLALCLDCDECFEIGYDVCPACGSKTWTSLARFLEIGPSESVSQLVEGIIDEKASAHDRAQPAGEARHLIIVARDRRALYDHLRRAFAGNDTVRVILDRRVNERRGKGDAVLPERRRSSRRSSALADTQLDAFGWSVVVKDLPDGHH
jgi:hypothetical protein